MVRKRLLTLALPLAALLVAPAPAAAQMNQYEMQHGQTIEVSVDNLLSMPESYDGRAVRTRGELGMVPGSTTQVVYGLRGTFGGWLVITPMPEAAYDWEQSARRWSGKEVEVTGVVSSGSSGGQQFVLIRIWGFLGPPDEKAPRKGTTPFVSLEDLVTKPGAMDGKLVTVKGQFRGANLFGDLPSASRRRSADWVIKDDLFAAWVTGRKAKGAGWNLDAGMRKDTGKWMEVTGRVTTNRGVVTLEAVDVSLAKPPAAPAAAETRAKEPAAPPAPRPPRSPVVAFSLPLDGERDVPPDTVFRVQFSKDMDEASLKDRVVLRYAGRPQPGDRELDSVRVSYDGGLRTLEIDPGDLLRPGRVVEVLLLPGILDIDGQPLETRPGFTAGAATDVLRFQIAAPGFAGR
jgi:hypothetical protein